MKSYQAPFEESREGIDCHYSGITPETLPIIKAYLIGKGYKVCAEYPKGFRVNTRLAHRTLSQAITVTQEIASDPMTPDYNSKHTEKTR